MAYQGPSGQQWRLILASDSQVELQEILEVLVALGKYDPESRLSHVMGPELELQIGYETTLVVRTEQTALRLVNLEEEEAI